MELDYNDTTRMIAPVIENSMGPVPRDAWYFTDS